jgi:hypothetical protein
VDPTSFKENRRRGDAGETPASVWPGKVGKLSERDQSTHNIRPSTKFGVHTVVLLDTVSAG